MNKDTILICILAIVMVANVAWAIVGGIKDSRKRSVNGEIVTNMSIATRNIKAACVNVGIACLMLIWHVLFHLHK